MRLLTKSRRRNKHADRRYIHKCERTTAWNRLCILYRVTRVDFYGASVPRFFVTWGAYADRKQTDELR